MEDNNKTVTRKFMIIALSVTVLINAALSAAIMGGLLKSQSRGMPDMPGKERPGSEMFSEDSRSNGGQMTAPEEGQQNGSAEQASKVSIGIIIKEDSGVYIAKVTGENAKNAGFKEGDKIVSIDNKDVNSSSDLINEVQSHKAGDTVSVTVERDGQPLEFKTELE